MVVSILLFVPGIFLFYAASRKRFLTQGPDPAWSRSLIIVARITGLICIIAGGAIAIWRCGPGAGLFISSVVLMAVTSLIALLFPLCIRE